MFADHYDRQIFQQKPRLALYHDRNGDVPGRFLPGTALPRNGHGLLAGFNPGAAYGPAKCWPVEKFRILAARMFLELPDLRIVVMGTEKEHEIAREICQGYEDRCFNLAGQTGLADVIALIDTLDLLVTNDSGLMHVGAGLDTPLVAIFGSTNPVTTGPWSDRSSVVRIDLECSPCLKRRCPEGTFDCMNGIGVDIVFDHCTRLLAMYSGYSGGMYGSQDACPA
jgi:heptosyltransferase-2